MKTQKKVKVNYFKLIRGLVIIGLTIYLIIEIFNKILEPGIPLNYEGEYTIYYVSKGETLWTIAKQQNFENKDLREIIHIIEKDNNIDGHLTIGQELKLRSIYE